MFSVTYVTDGINCWMVKLYLAAVTVSYPWRTL